MLGVVLHAPKDLRIEQVDAVPPGPGEVEVHIRAGGICGSDLHYYHHGGTGMIRLKEPMALGHEISGVIARVGAGVEGLTEGDPVAVNPSGPCYQCEYCLRGAHNQCMDMRFMGSAMRMPHVQGGFRQSVTVPASQAVRLPEGLSLAEAATAEPLAVCLHAAMVAGDLKGKRVLVTGCGPIGCLLVAVARLAGAAEIVATDIGDFALARARAMGADLAVNTASQADLLEPYKAGKGSFDVLFEASGVAPALVGVLPMLRAGAVVVQVGLGGDFNLPINVLVTKELQLRGSFRFDGEFALALELMGRGRIDVKPLITHSVDFREAERGFLLASDRSEAMKVQLTFEAA